MASTPLLVLPKSNSPKPTLEALTARRREVANEMCRRDVELSVIEKALNVKLQEPDAKEEDIQALVNEISIKTEEFDETMAESTRVGAKVERIKLDMYKLVVEAEKLDKEKAGEA